VSRILGGGGQTTTGALTGAGIPGFAVIPLIGTWTSLGLRTLADNQIANSIKPIWFRFIGFSAWAAAITDA
jgi:hypothetical protein